MQPKNHHRVVIAMLAVLLCAAAFAEERTEPLVEIDVLSVDHKVFKGENAQVVIRVTAPTDRAIRIVKAEDIDAFGGTAYTSPDGKQHYPGPHMHRTRLRDDDSREVPAGGVAQVRFFIRSLPLGMLGAHQVRVSVRPLSNGKEYRRELIVTVRPFDPKLIRQRLVVRPPAGAAPGTKDVHLLLIEDGGTWLFYDDGPPGHTLFRLWRVPPDAQITATMEDVSEPDYETVRIEHVEQGRRISGVILRGGVVLVEPELPVPAGAPEGRDAR